MEKEQLPEIPPGQYKYNNYPTFVHWPKGSDDEWHVFGPADQMLEGGVAEVIRYMDNGKEPEPVEILKHVAERHVAKRDGTRIRFVMAIFDTVLREDNK